MSPNPTMPGGHLVNISFNVPFNSNLPGPDKEDVLYSSLGAFQKWTHPDGTVEGQRGDRLGAADTGRERRDRGPQ